MKYISDGGAGGRLFSSAVFNDAFPARGEPEVLATPLEGVALTMRALGIDKVRRPEERAWLCAIFSQVRCKRPRFCFNEALSLCAPCSNWAQPL